MFGPVDKWERFAIQANSHIDQQSRFNGIHAGFTGDFISDSSVIQREQIGPWIIQGPICAMKSVPGNR
jgi:hypothetical protein